MWLKDVVKEVVIFVADVVIIVYVGTTIALGIVGGMALGGLITENPIGAILGGITGALSGFTFGATTGLWAVKKFDNWVRKW